MKKIVALALCLVLALSLCATAFAAPSTVNFLSYKDTTANTLQTATGTATFVKAVAAKTNDDGEQTNTANVAHYTLTGITPTGTGTYVQVATLAEADIVLYADADGKNVAMYLDETVVSYTGTGTVFTNFGKGCGQVDYANEKGETYYTTNDNTTGTKDDGIYVADKDGDKALMVGGKLVLVANAAVADTKVNKVKHAAVPTIKDGKVTGYTCSKCGAVAVEAANVASIPSDAEVVAGTTTWYFPAKAVSGTTSGSKVDSAKTFDAGIALYVGMSISAVAGSAVVIGKKKEF